MHRGCSSGIPHTYPDYPPHALHIPWEAGLTIPNPETLQIIRRLVALAILVLELIAELQESGAGYRFAVSQLCTVIVVLGRSSDVLVTNQDGVSSQSIQ